MLRSIFALSLFMFICSASPSHAAACELSVSEVNFSNVDTLGSGGSFTSAVASITCQDVQTENTITACLGLGAGTGGASGDVRLATGGTDPLQYTLFADSGHTKPWGNSQNTSLGSAQRIEIPVNGGTAHEEINLYAATVGNQGTIKPGTYISTFEGPDAQLDYAEGTALQCDGSAGQASTNASFTVSAMVEANCLIQTTDINFGTIGLITQPISGQGNLAVTCTPGADYSIELNGGLSGATDPTQRKMRRLSGSETVTYGLYSDPTGNNPWGSASGVNTVEATATGTENIPVYGIVPAQPAKPGSYNDTVTVTVRY